MESTDTIRAKMLQASTRTLAEVCPADHINDPALAAFTASRIVARVLDARQFSLETLPLPPIPRPFEAQLEVLWRYYQAANTDRPGADRRAIVGAIDRIVAELYQLTLNDLMSFELDASSAQDALTPK